MVELEVAVGSAGDGPSAVVDEGVVSSAKQDEVVNIGVTERLDPSCDVVGIAPLWLAATAGEAAVSVTDSERSALRGGGGAD